jgi:hypothetical protein
VEFLPGIRVNSCIGVIENRDLWSPNTVIMHVGTNDIETTTNLNYMDEVYSLVATTKLKFPHSRLFLNGVVRRKVVSWRRIRAINDTLLGSQSLRNPEVNYSPNRISGGECF